MMRAIEVISVNVGEAGAIATKTGRSGIFKRPADGPVEIAAGGVAGDVIVDRANHGGPDQAVYAYCMGDYEWWAAELGRPLEPGLFGENLTLGGCVSADFAVGDVLTVGSLRLEVTSPRIPCDTFEARMGVKGFVRRFLEVGRPGPYFRVMAEGPVATGDHGALVPFDGPRTPIADLMRPGPLRNLPPEEKARLLAAPLHIGLRRLLGG